MQDTAHDVTVTILETGRCSADVQAAARSVLSADELARFKEFHFDRDRRDYALAHALLRRSLSDRDPGTSPQDWRFETRQGGKPQLAGRSDLEFSLTHARGLVACAVTATGPVGIDAETDTRSVEVDLLMNEVCSVRERRALAQLPDLERRSRFLDFWTLKEALLKAHGLGLSEDLAGLDFQIGSDLEIDFKMPRSFPDTPLSCRLVRVRGLGRVAVAGSGPVRAAAVRMVQPSSLTQPFPAA